MFLFLKIFLTGIFREYYIITVLMKNFFADVTFVIMRTAGTSCETVNFQFDKDDNFLPFIQYNKSHRITKKERGCV